VSGPTRGMAGHRNVFGHGPNVDKEKAFFSPSAAGGCDIGWRVSSSSDFFGAGAGLGGRRCGSKCFSHNFIRTRGLLPLFAATTTHSRSRSRSRAHAFPPAIENTLFLNPSIDFPWSPQFHSPRTLASPESPSCGQASKVRHGSVSVETSTKPREFQAGVAKSRDLDFDHRKKKIKNRDQDMR
jgi:hypothetical protein